MPRANSIDFCTKPFIKKIVLYTIPLILTALLQRLYNTADLIIVGQFCGKNSIAAVSATGSLVSMFTHLFIGMGTGASALVAKYIGAKKAKKVDAVAHTALIVGFLSGVFVGVIGFITADFFMRIMGTPDDVRQLATIYLRIYFCGAPFNLLYNFGAGVLRATGDTKRPLYILTLSGLLNVGLNALFVTAVKMDVGGVALATVLSQVLSAVLVVILLVKIDGYGKISFRRLKPDGKAFLEILAIGIPTGISGMISDISGVIVQSSLNTFGTAAIAGSGAAGDIQGYLYVSMYSFGQTCLVFISHNYGAGRTENFWPIIRRCFLMIFAIEATLGVLVIACPDPLLRIFNDDPEVIRFGRQRIYVVIPVCFLIGFCDTVAAALRGMGRAFVSTIVTIFNSCGVRLLLVYTLFAHFHTFFMLYITFDITIVSMFLMNGTCLLLVSHKIKRVFATSNANATDVPVPMSEAAATQNESPAE